MFPAEDGVRGLGRARGVGDGSQRQVGVVVVRSPRAVAAQRACICNQTLKTSQEITHLRQAQGAGSRVDAVRFQAMDDGSTAANFENQKITHLRQAREAGARVATRRFQAMGALSSTRTGPALPAPGPPSTNTTAAGLEAAALPAGASAAGAAAPQVTRLQSEGLPEEPRVVLVAWLDLEKKQASVTLSQTC